MIHSNLVAHTLQHTFEGAQLGTDQLIQREVEEHASD